MENSSFTPSTSQSWDSIVHQTIEHPDFKEALKVQRSLGEGSSRSSTVQITSVQPQCKQDNQYKHRDIHKYSS